MGEITTTSVASQAPREKLLRTIAMRIICYIESYQNGAHYCRGVDATMLAPMLILMAIIICIDGTASGGDGGSANCHDCGSD